MNVTSKQFCLKLTVIYYTVYQVIKVFEINGQ